jgi:hypothetical protein
VGASEVLKKSSNNQITHFHSISSDDTRVAGESEVSKTSRNNQNVSFHLPRINGVFFSPILLIATAVIPGILLVSLNWAGLIKHPTSNPTGNSSPNTPIKEEGSEKGRFEVEANDDKGTPFTNPKNQTVCIKFEAYGKWIAEPVRGKTTAKGYVEDNGKFAYYKNSAYEDAPAASLIMRNDNQSYDLIGEETTLPLEAKKTVYFLMNDIDNKYRDNKEKITVNWSIVDLKNCS